jgi:hypothetical protein
MCEHRTIFDYVELEGQKYSLENERCSVVEVTCIQREVKIGHPDTSGIVERYSTFYTKDGRFIGEIGGGP